MSQLGPEVVHSYSINNVGVTNITAIDLRIILLNATLEGIFCILFTFFFANFVCFYKERI